VYRILVWSLCYWKVSAGKFPRRFCYLTFCWAAPASTQWSLSWQLGRGWWSYLDLTRPHNVFPFAVPSKLCFTGSLPGFCSFFSSLNRPFFPFFLRAGSDPIDLWVLGHLFPMVSPVWRTVGVLVVFFWVFPRRFSEGGEPGLLLFLAAWAVSCPR